VGSLIPLIGAVAAGIPFVTTSGFDAGEALALLEAERVTTALPLFPAFTEALLDHPAFGATDFSTLRQVVTTGSPVLLERAQSAFAPARIVSGYGMTELCGVIAASPLDESDADRLAWDGVPFDGLELRIVDPDTGAQAEPGQPGEIVVRGPCTLTGYLKDVTATAAARDGDGWFHTGDRGRTGEPDRAGRRRVAFLGRYKDVLKVGGENVSPLEVEAFLSRHPAVRAVQVVGAPDARLDEVVAAFVELDPGAPAVDEAALIAFCRAGIARFKTPRHVRFVDPGGWPMSATKVDKAELRRRIADELSPPASHPAQAGRSS
jgi:fatty-acyl-CoA synthase/long-chain acyl-CoA synthetase